MALGDTSICEFECEAGGWIVTFDSTGNDMPWPLKTKDSTNQVFYVSRVELACVTVRAGIFDGSTGNLPSATVKRIFGRIPHGDQTYALSTFGQGITFDPMLKCGEATSILLDSSATGWMCGAIQGKTATR